MFDLARFRETEVIHGRWAMLATLGCIVAELNTGVNWVDAGKVELEQGSSYAGLPLPFDLTTLCILEVLLVGTIEVLRNGELDSEKRVCACPISLLLAHALACRARARMRPHASHVLPCLSTAVHHLTLRHALCSLRHRPGRRV